MTDWKPKPGEIIGYQWGGFPSDSCPVLFISEDPWECAEIYETPGELKYLPTSSSDTIYQLSKLSEETIKRAIPVLQQHGFYDEAIALLHDVIKGLRHELSLREDTTRRQAAFIAEHMGSATGTPQHMPAGC